MLKISGLTEEEKTLLHDHRKKSQTNLIRERAHGILLMGEGRSMVDIASILFVEEDTVRSWFHKFEEGRISSIFPKYSHNDNASKLTKKQKQEIAETLQNPPSEQGLPGSFWSVASLRSYLSAKYGVVYESDRSYHHIFEISHFSYKLPEAFDKKRNNALVKEHMAEIQKEMEHYQSPDWECFAADESSIVWETELKRAWLKKNQKTVIKADRIKQRQNYFGALNLNSGKHTLVPLSWKNTEAIIGALRSLSRAYPGKNSVLFATTQDGTVPKDYAIC